MSAGTAFDLLGVDAADAEPDCEFLLDFLEGAEEDVDADEEPAGAVVRMLLLPPPLLLVAELELPDLPTFSLLLCFLALPGTASLTLEPLPPDFGTSARLILSLGSEEPAGVAAADEAVAAADPAGVEGAGDSAAATAAVAAACDVVLLLTGVLGGWMTVGGGAAGGACVAGGTGGGGAGEAVRLSGVIFVVESEGANSGCSSKLGGAFLAFLADFSAFLAFFSAFSAFFCSLVEVPPLLPSFPSLCAFFSFLSFFAFLGLSCFLLPDSAFEWWSFLECSFLLELLDDSDFVEGGCVGGRSPKP